MLLHEVGWPLKKAENSGRGIVLNTPKQIHLDPRFSVASSTSHFRVSFVVQEGQARRCARDVTCSNPATMKVHCSSI